MIEGEREGRERERRERKREEREREEREREEREGWQWERRRGKAGGKSSER